MTDFHALYIRYANDLYRFSLYLCGNAMEAEDLVAETFARALTGKAPLRQETVKGYLLTIARNLFVESVRQRRRFSDFPPDLPVPGPTPDDRIDQGLELAAVCGFLESCSPVDRAALLLRADGLCYAEIAGALGITEASAKVKVHRLRLKLAQWRLDREGRNT